MLFDVLDEKSYLYYAMKNYSNPQCTGVAEIENDLGRIKLVNRLLKKYHETLEINERLTINHLMVLTNVFSVEPAVRLLFFCIDEDYHHALKSFLQFMKMVPKSIPEVNLSEIQVDDKLLECLKCL